MSAAESSLRPPPPDSAPVRGESVLVPLAVLLCLLLAIALRTGLEWRYFDQMLGDDGWCPQVASRVARGEHLYTEIGWPYGPLPVYVEAALFRLSRTIAWAPLLTTLLGVAALTAVYALSRSLLRRQEAAWVTAWAALLGAPTGLLTFLWHAYTPPVAWGAATSLLTVAAATRWVETRAPSALFATVVGAAAAVLSKPEFALAALGVLGASFWLARPARRHLLFLTLLIALPAAVGALRAGPSTLGAWWRGYSGYDLLRVGQVELTAGSGLYGRLLVPLMLVLGLRWRTVGWLLAAACAALAFVWLKDVSTGTRTLSPATNDILAAAWLGALPALVWLGHRARRRALPGAFWLLWVYAVLVNLRFFLIGEFAAAAGAPVAVLAIVAVRCGLIAVPARAGLAVLFAVVLVPALAAEKRALRAPRLAVPVATALGTVRVPASHATTITQGLDYLASAPAGPLFVSGGGPGWYVLSGRRNPAGFDVLLRGLGTTEPEGSRLLGRLRADPPAVVIVEQERDRAPDLVLGMLLESAGIGYERHARLGGGRWQFYARK